MDNGTEPVDEFDPQELARAEDELNAEKRMDVSEAKEFLHKRKRAYMSVFSTNKCTQGDLDIVLLDLAWFCKEMVPSFNPQDGGHAQILANMKDGRREVFHRIKDHINLDIDVLMIKYHSNL